MVRAVAQDVLDVPAHAGFAVICIDEDEFKRLASALDLVDQRGQSFLGRAGNEFDIGESGAVGGGAMWIDIERVNLRCVRRENCKAARTVDADLDGAARPLDAEQRAQRRAFGVGHHPFIVCAG